MQQRPRLSLRLPAAEPELSEGPEARLALVAGAIRTKTGLQAPYNGQQVLLAPQILFTRHEAPHLEAAVIERDGRRDEETRLRTFNLAGLHELRTSGRRFAPQDLNLDEAKYEREEVRMLAAVAAGAAEPPAPAPVACSQARPWGVHRRLDESGACPRCGWRAEER